MMDCNCVWVLLHVGFDHDWALARVLHPSRSSWQRYQPYTAEQVVDGVHLNNCI